MTKKPNDELSSISNKKGLEKDFIEYMIETGGPAYEMGVWDRNYYDDMREVLKDPINQEIVLIFFEMQQGSELKDRSEFEALWGFVPYKKEVIGYIYERLSLDYEEVEERLDSMKENMVISNKQLDMDRLFKEKLNAEDCRIYEVEGVVLGYIEHYILPQKVKSDIKDYYSEK